MIIQFTNNTQLDSRDTRRIADIYHLLHISQLQLEVTELDRIHQSDEIISVSTSTEHWMNED